MPQLRITPALRAKLKARGLEVVAHQPVSLFRGARKLALVPEPTDPWRVTLYRAGAGWIVDPVGHAEADTLQEAIEAAMGSGCLRGALDRLAGEIEALTAVLRA